jgi:hypothetical protein
MFCFIMHLCISLKDWKWKAVSVLAKGLPRPDLIWCDLVCKMWHHCVWEGMVLVFEVASVYRLTLIYITDAFQEMVPYITMF